MMVRASFIAFGALAAGSVLALAPVGAFAQTEAGNRKAYEYAVRCFFADSYIASSAGKKGDAARQAVFVASAKRSFDGALKLGRIMGLSNEQMNNDLDASQSQEVKRLVFDPAFLDQTAADCKALGLM